MPTATAPIPQATPAPVKPAPIAMMPEVPKEEEVSPYLVDGKVP